MNNNFQEGFWGAISPFLFNKKKLLQAEREVSNIIRYTTPKRKNILDVCCGMGRHSIEFEKRGYTVLGLDSSDHLISIAKNSNFYNKNLFFYHTNFLSYNKLMKYPLVTCLWNSFGFEEDRCANDVFLNKLCDCVEPDGYLILSFACEEVIKNRYHPYSTKQLNNTIQEKYKILDKKIEPSRHNGFSVINLL